MTNKPFSSGLPKFDEFIGGLLPGDSLLVIGPESGSRRQLLDSFAESATRDRRHIQLLAPDQPPGNVPKRGSLQAPLSVRPGSLVVVEDLGGWSRQFKSPRKTEALVARLAEEARRRRSFALICTQRTDFPPQALAALKELVTLCIELVPFRNEVYCMPLSLRNRYIPPSLIPLRFRLSDLRQSGEAAAQPPENLAPLEARYERLFEQAPEGLALFDLQGGYREFNRKALELLDRPAEELKASAIPSLVDPAERRLALRWLSQLRSRKAVTGLFHVARSDRKSLPVEVHCSEIGSGLCLAILRDVSGRVKLEDARQRREEQYRSMVEQSGVGVLIADRGRTVFANTALLEMLGKGDTLPALKEIFLPESVRSLQQAAPRQALQVSLRRRDGTILECEARLSPTVVEGRECRQIALVDVSERKKACDALARSEARYRALVERSSAPGLVVEDDAVTFANAAAASLFGLPAADGLIGKPLGALVSAPENIAELLRKKIQSSRTGTATLSGTCRRDGETVALELTAVSADHRLLIFPRDASRERELERTVEENARNLAVLRRVGEVSSDISQGERIVQQFNVRLSEVLGFEMSSIYLMDARGEELVLRHHRQVPPALVAKLASLPASEGLGAFLAKTQEPQLLPLRKYPSYLPHRATFAEAGCTVVCFLPLVAGERLVGLSILATKREPAGALPSRDLLGALAVSVGSALEHSRLFGTASAGEERQRRLLDALDQVVYVAAPNGSMEYVSQHVRRLIGYQQKEFQRDRSLWLKLVHPDDKKNILERTTNLASLPEKTTIQYRMLPKGKAQYRLMEDTATIVKDADGEVVTLLGSVADITERDAAVHTLMAERNRSVQTLNSLGDGIAAFDRNYRVVVWNPVMTSITGLGESDVLGRGDVLQMLGLQDTPFGTSFGAVLDGEAVSLEEVRIAVPSTGKQAAAACRLLPLHDGEGEPAGVVAVFMGPGGRRSAEGEMRESEQILRNVIDTMGDILMITDLRGAVLEVNKSFLRNLGYRRSETIGHEFPYPWLLEEEMGRFVLWIATLRERSWLHDFDMTWRGSDGRLIPMSLSTTLLRNSMGEPIAMLNIARDITERTRMARDLESRNRQIEMINRIISKANQTMDFDEIFGAIAEEIKQVVRADDITVSILEEDEASVVSYALTGGNALSKGVTIPLDRAVTQLVLEEREPTVIGDLLADPRYQGLAVQKRGLRSILVFPILLKGTAFGSLNIGAKVVNAFEEEDVQMLAPLAQQMGAIFDRVQLFRQVTEDSTYIHNLLDSIDSIVYTVDTQYRIREVNKAWHEFMKESGVIGVRNYHGVNFFDVLPSDALKVMFQNIVDDLLSGRIRIFSQEFVHQTPSGERIYQITVNPMVIDRKITGLVFTHTDITALKRTEAELTRNNEQLLALYEISTRINTSLDLQEILDTTLPLLRKDMTARAVLIYLIDPVDNALVLTKQLGLEYVPHTPLMRLEQTASLTGTVLKSRQPLYVTDKVFLDERISPKNREVLQAVHCEALAIVPLMSKDRVLGAVLLLYDVPYQFAAQERQILTLIGGQLGTAIENAQLYGELRSQIDRLTVLYEFSQQLTSTLEAEQVLTSVYQSLYQVAPYEAFTIHLYDPLMKALTPAVNVVRDAQGPRQQEAAAQAHAIVPGSPEAAVIETKRPVQDLEQVTMYAPMLSKEAIMGLMAVKGSPEQPYTLNHLRLLESIGNLTAIALEKAKLYEETVKISLEIQRRNKELDDFTYVVSHDLKEPLISIEGFSRILQADYRDVIQGDGKEYLDSIVGATTRMKGLIDDLLMLSRVSRPAEAFKIVQVKTVIDELRTDMEFTIRQKGVRVVVKEDLPNVFGNETHLKIVFRNLIGNAIKFNNKPDPMVEIGFRNAENNMYLFYVRDNGIGIDREFYEKIFVIFQRLHRREEYEGTGAGLAIVKKIVEMHKGRIWIESTLGEGSTFYFTVPKGYTHES